MAAPRVQTLAPDASAPFARVVDRALEFRREDRYESAGAMREDVRRAIAELDGHARTQLAVSAPLPPAPSLAAPSLAAPSLAAPSLAAPLLAAPSLAAFAESPPEATIEVSASELETSASLKATRKLGGTPPPSDESIRIPRRRPLLPWVALVLVSGFGGWMWLGVHRRAAHVSAPASQPSAAPVAENAARDAGAVETQPAAPASAATSAAPHAAAAPPSAAPGHTPPTPAPSPAAAAAHRPPAKVGPGNVHKLKGGHHARRAPAPPSATHQ
jgi:hypothetical protein